MFISNRRTLKYSRIISSSFGGFIGMAVIALLSELSGGGFLIPSFGATCFILFVISDSAYAQPLNVVCGHVLSSMIGIMCYAMWQNHWWSLAVAVGTAIALMQLTKTMHPPAAADPAIIIMQGGVTWSFLIAPVLSGSVVLVLLAYIYNNFLAGRPYPKKVMALKRDATAKYN